MNMTNEETNLELDYILCNKLKLTMEELDELPIKVVNALRNELYKQLKGV